MIIDNIFEVLAGFITGGSLTWIVYYKQNKRLKKNEVLLRESEVDERDFRLNQEFIDKTQSRIEDMFERLNRLSEEKLEEQKRFQDELDRLQEDFNLKEKVYFETVRLLREELANVKSELIYANGLRCDRVICSDRVSMLGE